LITFAAKHERSEVYCLNFVEAADIATDRVAGYVTGYVPWLPWQLLQLVLRFINNFSDRL